MLHHRERMEAKARSRNSSSRALTTVINLEYGMTRATLKKRATLKRLLSIQIHHSSSQPLPFLPPVKRQACAEFSDSMHRLHTLCNATNEVKL